MRSFPQAAAPTRRRAIAQGLAFGLYGCASAPPAQDRAGGGNTGNEASYQLIVRVRPDQRAMDVSGVLRPPASERVISELRLALAPSARNVEFSLSGPRPEGMLDVADAPREDGDREWTLRFAHPLAPAQTEIHFSYSMDGASSPLFYIGPEVCFASAWGTNWYPVLVGDAGKARGSLQIEVPSTWTAIASDRRVGAPDDREQGVFRYDVAYPTFLSFAAGPYAFVETSQSSLGAYLLQPHEHVASLLNGSQQILDVLSAEFGPFPPAGFSLVEVPRNIAQLSGFNAASLPGFLLLNSNAFNAPAVDYLLEWLGHEFSHQWFPHKVALRTPPGVYVEESIAEYGGWRAVEALAGASAAEQLRRTGFQYDPIYSAAAYFRIATAGEDKPLAQTVARERFAAARNIAYSKGAFVFYMLAQQLGAAQFRDAIRSLMRRRAFEEISWAEFQAAFERVSQQDLGQFFEQWFNRVGAPDFTLD